MYFTTTTEHPLSIYEWDDRAWSVAKREPLQLCGRGFRGRRCTSEPVCRRGERVQLDRARWNVGSRQWQPRLVVGRRECRRWVTGGGGRCAGCTVDSIDRDDRTRLPARRVV